MRASAERARRTVDCVKPVVAPPVLADAQAPEQVVVALDRAVRRHREMVAGCEALARLEKVPELADVEALTALGKQLRAAGREVEKLAAGRDAMDRLVDVPALVDVTAVEAFIAQFTEKVRRAQAVAVDVVELGKQLAEIEERLRVWAEANSTCPVCGGEIDPERVLSSEEHSHV
jgi:hypothetical protein